MEQCIVIDSGQTYVRPKYNRFQNPAEEGEIYDVIKRYEVNRDEYGYDIKNIQTGEIFTINEKGVKIIKEEIDQYEEWED